MFTKILNFFTYLLNKKILLLETVGFDSIKDLWIAVFGIKMKTSIPMLAVTLSYCLEFISSFIERNIYSPVLGVYLLFLFTIVDIVVGLSKAIRFRKEGEGNGIDASRLSRAMARFVMQIFIVGGIFQMSKVWEFVIRNWMVDAVILSFTITTLWSSIQNAYRLGWIERKSYEHLESIVNVDKLFNYFKKDKSSTNQIDPKK